MAERNDFDKIELHLIRVLQTLITERSVSRAAMRLRSTQPAVSAQLKRLRALTGDPLLVRSGNGMTPTQNYRVLMRAWNALFFTPGIIQPDQSKAAEWNRGRYLVEALAHCGACHTPKNAFGADKRDQAFGGSMVQGMFAPRLDGAARSGLKSWSAGDIAEYLHPSSGTRPDTHCTGAGVKRLLNVGRKVDSAAHGDGLHSRCVALKAALFLDDGDR